MHVACAASRIPTWPQSFFHVGISFYETYVTYIRGRGESRWDAGIRDSTYDCKFVNALDTALARYPPSIGKPNVSHILALFTCRNCSANFYQYLERREGKRAGSLVFVVLRGTIDFCETSVGPSPLVRIILFQGGDASLGRKKLPPSRASLLSPDRTRSRKHDWNSRRNNSF